MFPASFTDGAGAVLATYDDEVETRNVPVPLPFEVPGSVVHPAQPAVV